VLLMPPPPVMSGFMGRTSSDYAPEWRASKLRRCEPFQARVRSECFVVVPPFFDDPSDVRQTGEDLLVLGYIRFFWGVGGGSGYR